VIPRFITACLEDRRPVVFGDGEQSRDFTYIDNAVEANLLAAEAEAEGVAGEKFNIACGEQTTLNQLLEAIRRLTGKGIEAEYLPRRPGDVPHSLADVSRARERLGYEVGIGIREGLERTVEHIENVSGGPTGQRL
jgi:UDP-glucose 4-epimerase